MGEQHAMTAFEMDEREATTIVLSALCMQMDAPSALAINSIISKPVQERPVYAAKILASVARDSAVALEVIRSAGLAGILRNETAARTAPAAR